MTTPSELMHVPDVTLSVSTPQQMSQHIAFTSYLYRLDRRLT